MHLVSLALVENAEGSTCRFDSIKLRACPDIDSAGFRWVVFDPDRLTETDGSCSCIEIDRWRCLIFGETFFGLSCWLCSSAACMINFPTELQRSHVDTCAVPWSACSSHVPPVPPQTLTYQLWRFFGGLHPGRSTAGTYKSPMKRKENDLPFTSMRKCASR